MTVYVTAIYLAPAEIAFAIHVSLPQMKYTEKKHSVYILKIKISDCSSESENNSFPILRHNHNWGYTCKFFFKLIIKSINYCQLSCRHHKKYVNPAKDWQLDSAHEFLVRGYNKKKDLWRLLYCLTAVFISGKWSQKNFSFVQAAPNEFNLWCIGSGWNLNLSPNKALVYICCTLVSTIEKQKDLITVLFDVF